MWGIAKQVGQHHYIYILYEKSHSLCNMWIKFMQGGHSEYNDLYGVNTLNKFICIYFTM